MNWMQWVTFVIAALGAGLGVFNTVMGYRRGVRRIRVECGFEEVPRRGQPRLWCKVVNTGSVSVSIAAVTMTLVVEGQPQETAIYGDTAVERRMLGERVPGAAFKESAPAQYEPFFLKLLRIDAKTECGKFARVDARMLRNTQIELRASLEQARLRELAEAAPGRDAARAANKFPS